MENADVRVGTPYIAELIPFAKMWEVGHVVRLDGDLVMLQATHLRQVIKGETVDTDISTQLPAPFSLANAPVTFLPHPEGFSQ